jgi:hypothetical protein
MVNGIDGVPTSVTACRNGGGFTGAVYVQDESQFAADVLAPYDGCTTVTEEGWNGSSWSVSGAAEVHARTSTGCSAAWFPYSTGGSTASAVQAIDYANVGCHEYACDDVDGLPAVEELTWSFWTTGSDTPS